MWAEAGILGHHCLLCDDMSRMDQLQFAKVLVDGVSCRAMWLLSAETYSEVPLDASSHNLYELSTHYHCHVIKASLVLCPGEPDVCLHGSSDDMVMCMMIT